MSKIKILIVEDELLTATDIEEKLSNIGYSIVGITQTSSEAIRFVKQKQPDIILMDIQISGATDGIETASLILKEWNGPIVFLTAFSDKEYVDRAKQLLPAAYLLKPFNVDQFAIHLEMAIHNFINQYNSSIVNQNNVLHNAIFILIDQVYQKVFKEDILFIEASGSYVNIQTTTQKFMVSTNLKSIEKQIADNSFQRIHRRYIINMLHVNKIELSLIYLDNYSEPLPIGELYRNGIYKYLKIIKSKTA